MHSFVCGDIRTGQFEYTLTIKGFYNRETGLALYLWATALFVIQYLTRGRDWNLDFIFIFMKRKKGFRLIIGGAAEKIELNNIEIEVMSHSAISPPVDVRVFEEDTYLVLTVDPVMRYVDEHPVRLMTRIMDAKPHIPGSVVRKNSSWYAVVHDLDAEPISRKEWIDTAYEEALRLAEEYGVARLGMPLLGAVHGRYPVRDSLQMLTNHIRKQNLSRIQKIVILAKKGAEEAVRKLLVQIVRS